MDCDGCKCALKLDDYLKCCMCQGKYHYQCLNMKVEQFKLLSKEYCSTWTCPACTNVTRRTRSNLNTPVRQNQIPQMEESMDMSCDLLVVDQITSAGSSCLVAASSSPAITEGETVTLGKISELLDQKLSTTIDKFHTWHNEVNLSINQLRQDVKLTLAEIRKEVMDLKSEQASLKLSVSEVSHDIELLKKSTQYQSDEHNDLKQRVENLSQRSTESAAAAISNLEDKIDLLEQQARQCNVEICNVPERRNENLPGIIEAICAAINCQVSQRDIVSFHRVPHAQQNRDKPKNIILKLTTRIQRDNMLSAFRRKKLLKSDQLGIAGTPTTIYMNEHLTLKKKQLFRKCREATKKTHYKYVWIRNATILVREHDDSPAMAIRSDGDIAKIKINNKKL